MNQVCEFSLAFAGFYREIFYSPWPTGHEYWNCPIDLRYIVNNPAAIAILAVAPFTRDRFIIRAKMVGKAGLMYIENNHDSKEKERRERFILFT